MSFTEPPLPRLPLWDRLLRSLFVATAVGLLWGIRGSFGHLLGAMAPGAALGLAFAYVTGQRSMFRWMPILGAFGGLFISIGGAMSYGILHGYAQADTFINWTYGFATLFMQGGIWGGFGGAALGLLLERGEKRMKTGEWVALIGIAFLAGWVTEFVVVHLIGFHINPPRNNLSINYAGRMAAVFVWLAANGKRRGLKGALLGFVGFGIGMSFGRFLGNCARHLPFDINHWNIMEISAGFFGGLIFTLGMLGMKFDNPPEDEGWPLVSRLSMVYVLGFIPLMHRLLRIRPDQKLGEWTKNLDAWEYHNPKELAIRILDGLNFVAALGFLFAGIWYLLWRGEKWRWSAFPVLALCLLMTLIQNLNALTWFHPPRENYIDTDYLDWVMLGLMLVFVLAFEFVWPRREVVQTEEVAERLHARRWIALSAATFLLVIGLSAYVNGEKTMTSANTRWPIWSWQDESKKKEQEAKVAAEEQAAAEAAEQARLEAEPAAASGPLSEEPATATDEPVVAPLPETRP